MAMTEEDRDKAEQVVTMAMEVLKQLGARAAILAYDTGMSSSPGKTRVDLICGGGNDQVVRDLGMAIASQMDGVMLQEDNDADDMEALQREALARMRKQAKAGELVHLSEYTASVRLGKPLL